MGVSGNQTFWEVVLNKWQNLDTDLSVSGFTNLYRKMDTI
jgi:hypothetical protein